MIALRNFQGEIPRVTAHLLPDNAAQLALDCNFANGDLKPLKMPELVTPTPMATLVQSLYTEDGLNFFTWATDVSVVKSPVLGEQYGRVYYADGTDFRVTQYSLARTNGGNPSSSWKVGVPAPSLQAVQAINRSSLPDNAVLEWKFFYEANGVKYQEQTITPAVVTLGREYTFTAPAILVLEEGSTEVTPPANDRLVTETAEAFRATPANAIPCVYVRGVNPTTGAEIFRAFSTNSSFAADNDTDRFNGITVEIAANLNSNVVVKFGYGGGFEQTRAIVATAVNIFGEESAPSAPLLVSYDIMQVPRVTIAPPTSTNYLPIAYYKVYGTVTASTGDADYQFIQTANWSWSAVAVDITTKPEEWGDIIETKSHLPPPADLHGLGQINGITFGFRKNELWFSQPYKPWAWRPQDALTLRHAIKSTLAHAGQIIVTTTAQPSIVTGLLPESMTERRLDVIHAGVGRNSLIDCGSFAAYATNDGLCTIIAGAASMDMSFTKFDRATWQSRYGANLSNLRLAYHDGAIIGFFPSGVSSFGFVWRIDDGGGLFSQSTVTGDGAFILPQLDALYISSGQFIRRFGTGTPSILAQWRSKKFIMPKPTNMGAAQVMISGTALFRVYADDVQVFSTTLFSSSTMRLPAGFKPRQYEVEILNSTDSVREILVAETQAGLARV